MKFNSFFVILYCFCSYGCKKEETMEVNISSLLREMTNRESLTRFPVYKLLQVSTWDRTQRNPEDATTWFGNKDYGFFIREEKNNGRNEYVILDTVGPGVITRWWMPQEQLLKHRVLRIYLDGNSVPVIEENYQDFMNGTSFVKWPFAFTSSDEKDSLFQYDLPVGHPKQMGSDMYFPIPFSKRCKITLDDKPFYYVINYRLYPEGTNVSSFSREDYQANLKLIETTAQTLFERNMVMADAITKSAVLAPHEKLVFGLTAKNKAINGIRLKANSKENKQVNRALVMEISFDGTKTITSPISEFFGGGVYARPVKNYFSAVDDQGVMNSNWMMPYKEKAEISLTNYSRDSVSVEISVSSIDYNWETNSMYFHADWHEESPLNTPPFKDWNFVEATGKGIYVGDVLTIQSTTKPWWGEGDEKIYIDEEKFPSQLGTGLEDYYGYAWGFANFFSSPFISMPERDARGKDDWRGYNTASRVRLLDAIPFEKKVKIDIEAWQTQPGVSYSATTFWYALPGATDNISFDPQTLERILPAFIPIAKVLTPGKVYPDPLPTGSPRVKGKGIQHVGNQLDLLDWRNVAVKKQLDADQDNMLGSAGYHLIGIKRFSVREMDFLRDSLLELPDFITSLTFGNVTHSFRDAWLFIPQDTAVGYITGKIEMIGSRSSKGLISFKLGDKVPASFRLGVMLDNADTFNKVGKSIFIKSSNGLQSGEIKLATSNRIPDWYFFDITNAKVGDSITISGTTEEPGDLFSLGGVTFDITQ